MSELPPVAVLAGGLATRMRPLTETIPKAMIDLAGAPFVAHQLRLLAGKGVSDVVLLLGYRGERVVDYVGDGAAFGVRVRYSHDGPTQLGTGGALRKALPLLGPTFMVLYGDSYLDIDYGAVFAAWRAARADGLMTVFRNDDKLDRSNVVFADGMVRHYSKTARLPEMHWIDYGVSVLGAADFEAMAPDTPFALEQVFETIIGRGRMAGFEIRTRFYEIGSREGLAETEAYLSAKAGRS
jgi:NDP-sugar pyrophosphorylase family protein